ncbi:tetratricopeptide repeat protein [Candidatus Poribacteria bacterium]|nr:tetratricopeptide repeat protein [Candidatus Poribacteria bacterium]
MVDKDRLFRDASEYYQQGKWDKAIDVYNKILKIDPDNLNVFNMLGDVYVSKNEISKAYEKYKKAADAFENQGLLNKAVAVNKKILRVNPDDINTYIKLAELHTQLGFIGEANEHYLKASDIYSKEKNIAKLLEIYKKIVNINPKNLSIRLRLVKMYLNENMKQEAALEYVNIAEKYKENNQADTAINILENAKKELPEFLEINFCLGKLYNEKNEPEKAFMEIQSVFNKNPSDKSAFLELSKIYRILGRINEIIPLYEAFVKNSPQEIDIKKELVSVYLQNFIFDKTEILLNEICQIEKENTNTHKQYIEVLTKLNKEKELLGEYILIGELYLKNGQNNDAVDSFQKALEKDPENIICIKYLAKLYETQGNKEKSSEYFLHLAKIEEKIEQKEEAIENYKKIIQFNPDDMEVLSKLAELYHDLKRNDAAIEALQSLTTKGKDDAKTWKLLGTILFDTKKYQEAEEAYEKALKTESNNGINERLAEIYLKQNKIEKAIIAFQNILESDPGNMEVSSRLSELKMSLSSSDINKDTKDEEENQQINKEGGTVEKKIEPRIDKETFILPKDSILNYLDEARLRVDRKQIEQAIELFKSVLKIDKANEEAKFMLKEIVPDRYQKILNDIEKELILEKPKPKETKIKPLFLDEEIEEESLENIIAAFRSGVTEDIEEEDFESHYNLGIAYKETGLLDEAIEEFKIAAQKEENMVQCYGILGICYLEKGQYDFAIKYFILAIENPKYDELSYRWVKYDLGLAYKKNKEPEKALKFFQEVAKMDEDYRDVKNEIEQVKKKTAESSFEDKEKNKDNKKNKINVSYI